MTEPPRTAHVGNDPRILELPRCALVILSGDSRGKEKVIEGDLFRIGKSKENELVLADEAVGPVACASEPASIRSPRDTVGPQNAAST